MPYVTGKTIDSVIELLAKYLVAIFKWFSDKQMQGNTHECHILISTEKSACKYRYSTI